MAFETENYEAGAKLQKQTPSLPSDKPIYKIVLFIFRKDSIKYFSKHFLPIPLIA